MVPEEARERDVEDFDEEGADDGTEENAGDEAEELERLVEDEETDVSGSGTVYLHRCADQLKVLGARRGNYLLERVNLAP